MRVNCQAGADGLGIGQHACLTCRHVPSSEGAETRGRAMWWGAARGASAGGMPWRRFRRDTSHSARGASERVLVA
jgi:hypothetical protein